jgi:hypothetical protein
MWADGVCINQNDLDERARQVSLMGLIYWKARKVLVWLGEDDEQEEQWKAHSAFRVIHKFRQLQWPKAKHGKTDPDFQEYGIEELQRGDDADDWEALRRLLRRKWFTRVWVVQELGLAFDASLHCGDCTIDLNDVYDWMRKLHVKAPLFSAYYGLSFEVLHLAWSYHRSTRGSMRIELGNDPTDAESFCDILQSARNLECTDPRDLVYAFLGHPSAFKQHPLDVEPYMWYPRNYYQGKSTIIQPDYGEDITPLDAYFRLAFTLIVDHDDGMKVLEHVGHHYETIEDNFPSWAPRWNVMGIYPFPSIETELSHFPPTPFEIDLHGAETSIGLRLKAALLDTLQFYGQTPATSHFAILPTDWAEHSWTEDTGLSSYNPVETMYRFLLELRPSLPNPHYHDDLNFATAFTAGLTIDDNGDETLVGDTNRYRHFQDYCAYRHAKAVNIIASKLGVDNPVDDIGNDEYHRNIEKGDAHRYLKALQQVAPLRTFFSTYDGRLGLGARLARGGDQVWLIMGSKTPYIFKPMGDGTFKILGQAYLHGAMQGDSAVELVEDDFRVVTLV